MYNIMLIFALICFSISLFTVCFQLTRTIFLAPKSDRQFYDPPPVGLKIILPVLHLCSVFFGQYIKKERAEKNLRLLRRSGADYMLNPIQFFFATPISGLIFVCIGWYLGILFELEPLLLGALFGIIGLTYPNSWIQRRIKNRESAIFKSLPHYLDIITLSIEAGCNFIGALTQAIEHSPNSPLKEEFSRVIRDIRAGQPKLEAIRNLNTRIKMPGVSSFVSAVTQSEKMGSSLGKALRSQSDQRRFERFARAEKLGLEAPVKLLGPLVMFIFPTTFIIIGFLVTVKLIATGIFQSQILVLLMSNPLNFFHKIIQLITG